ncbi:hypothetical protein BGZ65_012316 [Modicella reniformis]|uniref:Uncharacterized protein n=1 Tax=Modicella reniformis TaxID=1440133 RepID=A0A9P6SQT4_9FUNG|nr:hypothetical protein BGZ65_012316 [Modicella reniformis]
MDFEDSDEDEGVDEPWSSPWPKTFDESKMSSPGPATQFNASLTDWSEEFQDGFSEFRTGTAEDDGFDFPPFSVDHPHSDKTVHGANVDPFGDNFVVSSTGEGNVSVTKEEATEEGAIASSKVVDMEPVALAPEVQKNPVITQSGSTATNEQGGSVEATTPSESSAGVTIELEKVPLADAEAPKLQATEPSDPNSTSKESTTAKTPSSSETKTAGELDSQKAKDE